MFRISQIHCISLNVQFCTLDIFFFFLSEIKIESTKTSRSVTICKVDVMNTCTKTVAKVHKMKNSVCKSLFEVRVNKRTEWTIECRCYGKFVRNLVPWNFSFIWWIARYISSSYLLNLVVQEILLIFLVWLPLLFSVTHFNGFVNWRKACTSIVKVMRRTLQCVSDFIPNSSMQVDWFLSIARFFINTHHFILKSTFNLLCIFFISSFPSLFFSLFFCLFFFHLFLIIQTIVCK